MLNLFQHLRYMQCRDSETSSEWHYNSNLLDSSFLKVHHQNIHIKVPSFFSECWNFPFFVLSSIKLIFLELDEKIYRQTGHCVMPGEYAKCVASSTSLPIVQANRKTAVFKNTYRRCNKNFAWNSVKVFIHKFALRTSLSTAASHFIAKRHKKSIDCWNNFLDFLWEKFFFLN